MLGEHGMVIPALPEGTEELPGRGQAESGGSAGVGRRGRQRRSTQRDLEVGGDLVREAQTSPVCCDTKSKDQGIVDCETREVGRSPIT